MSFEPQHYVEDTLARMEFITDLSVDESGVVLVTMSDGDNEITYEDDLYDQGMWM